MKRYSIKLPFSWISPSKRLDFIPILLGPLNLSRQYICWPHAHTDQSNTLSCVFLGSTHHAGLFTSWIPIVLPACHMTENPAQGLTNQTTFQTVLNNKYSTQILLTCTKTNWFHQASKAYNTLNNILFKLFQLREQGWHLRIGLHL